MSFSLQNARWSLIAAALLIVVVCFLKPAGNRLSVMQIKQLQSNTQLKGISELVLAYRSKNGGNMPRSLSELVPDDQTDRLSVFFAPNEPQLQKPAGWLTNKTILDESSDYALPLHPNSNIVAFEKLGLWPDGTVAICFTNLSVKRMNASDFKTLLNDGHSQ